MFRLINSNAIMDAGNTVLVTPGFDVKAAGSLFLEKASPSGELGLPDLEICIHRDNLPAVLNKHLSFSFPIKLQNSSSFQDWKL